MFIFSKIKLINRKRFHFRSRNQRNGQNFLETEQFGSFLSPFFKKKQQNVGQKVLHHLMSKEAYTALVTMDLIPFYALNLYSVVLRRFQTCFASFSNKNLFVTSCFCCHSFGALKMHTHKLLSNWSRIHDLYNKCASVSAFIVTIVNLLHPISIRN